MRPYFAYGSNMHPGQFRERCPGSRVVGRARLPGYRFLITTSGYASVEPSDDPGAVVHGVLEELTPEDEATLDAYEGVREGLYRRDFLTVLRENNTPVQALVYVEMERREGQPRPGYLEAILEGARHHALPQEALDTLRRWQELDSLPASSPAMNAHRTVRFRDPRPPHEVVAVLERSLMVLATPHPAPPHLEYSLQIEQVGVSYALRLTCLAATPNHNLYGLDLHAHCPGRPDDQATGLLRSAPAWFDLWTQGLQPVREAEADADVAGNDEALLRRRCEAALTADAHLDTVARLQAAVLAAFRNGARVVTAHKEGGTTVSWTGSSFVRQDHGESRERQVIPDDTAFLVFLRRFLDWEVSRAVHPARLPEASAWKLILRRLDPG